MKENNIVLTGGHAATTALAVVQAVKKRGLAWKIYWIGTKKAVEGQSVATLEAQILPEYGVVFCPIVAGRIQRKFTRHTIPSLIKIPFGFIHALILLGKIKPKAILSFGGAASFPVVVVGKILGIPVIIHEQTSAVGRANKYSSRFATKIALARESSLQFFPKNKCVVTGNPILQEFEKISFKEGLAKTPAVLVTGGSRGSQTINQLLQGILEKLLENKKIIHQTGQMDFEKFSRIKQDLRPELKKNYQVLGTVSPGKMTELIINSDLVIARAGANTVSELIAAKKLSVLIPIPFSYEDEQTKNALFAEKLGLSRILFQSAATPERLLSAIEDIFANWDKLGETLKNIKSPDIGASGKVVDTLMGVMTK